MPTWSGRYAQRLTKLTLAVYGTTCHLCGKPGATTADHVVPRHNGGSDSIHNLRPAHSRCNSSRQDQPVEQWQTAHAPWMLRGGTKSKDDWSFFK